MFFDTFFSKLWNYGVVQFQSPEHASRGLLISDGEYPWQAVLDVPSRLGRYVGIRDIYYNNIVNYNGLGKGKRFYGGPQTTSGPQTTNANCNKRKQSF